MNLNQYRCDGKVLYLLNILNHSLDVQMPYDPEVPWLYFVIYVGGNKWYCSMSWDNVSSRPIFDVTALMPLSMLGFISPLLIGNVSMRVWL